MRALKANEVEVRIGTVGAKGVTLLLYKNARVDSKILDEEFGAMNWQCDFKEIKGNLFCGVGVWDDKKKQWIWKWDCGTESNTEKEKGEASDAYKRASFKWQLGVELYNSPFIFLQVKTDNLGNNRFKLHNPRELYGLYVSDMTVEDIGGTKTITALDIAQDGMIIWSTDRRKVGTRI
jgi:hypothetical protein